MKFIHHSFSILFVLLILVSCKNDATKNIVKDAKILPEKLVIKESATKNITNNKKAIASYQVNKPSENLLINLMSIPELKTYVRVMLSANLIDLLSKEDIKYTLFVPNNEAFDNISKDKMKDLLRSSNKEKLVEVLKTHILIGSFNSSSLKESISENGGKYKIKTLSNNYLTLSLEGDDVIVIEDEKGKKGLIEKTDINTSNGIIHAVDVLLEVD